MFRWIADLTTLVHNDERKWSKIWLLFLFSPQTVFFLYSSTTVIRRELLISVDLDSFAILILFCVLLSSNQATDQAWKDYPQIKKCRVCLFTRILNIFNILLLPHVLIWSLDLPVQLFYCCFLLSKWVVYINQVTHLSLLQKETQNMCLKKWVCLGK